jgi:hypothetical protein
MTGAAPEPKLWIDHQQLRRIAYLQNGCLEDRGDAGEAECVGAALTQHRLEAITSAAIR